MINYREVDKSYFKAYDDIPMLVHVNSYYALEKINNGLGGIILKEMPVKAFVKDLGKYEAASKYEAEFDISNWAFFMAFDGDQAIGAATVAAKTENVHMLDGRDDLSVLWDIRVAEDYKHQGIGQKLFDLAVDWSKANGFKQMKIECQNNNVPACKFYHKQGAVLSKIDEYAYYNDIEVRDEVQFIWYLDLQRMKSTKASATFFEDQDKFREWLELHHDKEKELIVGFYKVDSGKPSMNWSQSVDQALCFGWIDGVRRSIDNESYSIRFTPRKKTSIWSAINIRKVEELKKSGLMRPEGLKAFSYMTENKSEIYSHEKENVELDLEYEKQFKQDQVAWEFFNKQTPSYKKVMIHWIMSAKQEKTRQSRLDKTIAASRKLKRLD